MAVVIELAGGGDEPLEIRSVTYTRRATPSEVTREPGANSVVALVNSTRLFCVQTTQEIEAAFGDGARFAHLTLPNRTAVLVNAGAVIDVDPAPSTVTGNAWLVFGNGPRAPRLVIRETAAELRGIWEQLGLDPSTIGL